MPGMQKRTRNKLWIRRILLSRAASAAHYKKILGSADCCLQPAFSCPCVRISQATLAEAIKKIIPDARIEHPEYNLNMSLDITRIREDTGYEPAYNVERGIVEYVDWLRSGNER